MPTGHADPPFPRGSTFFGGMPIDTSNLANIGGEQYEGKEYHFEDTVYGSGNPVTLKVVRNMSGTTLYANYAVQPEWTDPNVQFPGMQRISGLTTDVNQTCWIIDELLSPVGCPPYDLFYVVVRGPNKALTPPGSNNILPSDALVSAVDGFVSEAAIPAPRQMTGTALQNYIGRSLQQLTTLQSGVQFVIFVGW